MIKMKGLIKKIKKQLPHSISDIMSAGWAVPERYPPTVVLDKVGSKRKSFAIRSMDITNKKGIQYTDVNVPQYEAMHGSEYKKKHKARLEKDWGRLF